MSEQGHQGNLEDRDSLSVSGHEANFVWFLKTVFLPVALANLELTL